MKKSLIIAFSLLAVVVVGFFWFNNFIYNEKQADGPTSGEIPFSQKTLTEYTVASNDLTFSYPDGLGGYALEDLPLASDGDESLLQTIRLTPTADYLEEQTRVGGESSPSWFISVYTNASNLEPAAWVEANASASNIGLSTSVKEEIVIAGAAAVLYSIDGLYPASVLVISFESNIFVVQSQFIDDTSPTKRDLDSWLDTFRFMAGEQLTPPVSSQKIDPQVACESALAYMTFQSGDDADAFVAACVAGEHPEVIDRYIESLGVDGMMI